MKKVIFLSLLMTMSFGMCYAQVVNPTGMEGPVLPDPESSLFYIGTYSIFLSLCSFLVTQICKAFDKVANTRWLKQVISLVVSIALAFATWALHIATFMDGYSWLQVLIIGIVGGMGGSGFYTYIKKNKMEGI